MAPNKKGIEKAIRPLFLLALILLIGCGPRRISLPTGAGIPASDFSTAFAAARSGCDGVRTFQAELGLSGRAGDQRLRGRLLAGVVPGALRLEGVPPFGSPIFILVADGSRGTLLLLRDRRVVENAPPEDILNALVGVRLGPNDLLALLSGCVRAAANATAARAYGTDWLAIELDAGGTVYLHRQNGAWQIVAGRYGGLEVDYVAFAGNRPSEVVLRSSGVNLTLTVNQVEINGELPRDQLVAVKIPPGVSPLSLEELRRAGPLGE